MPQFIKIIKLNILIEHDSNCRHTRDVTNPGCDHSELNDSHANLLISVMIVNRVATKFVQPSTTECKVHCETRYVRSHHIIVRSSNYI